jgi:hypothetical protein
MDFFEASVGLSYRQIGQKCNLQKPPIVAGARAHPTDRSDPPT